MHKLSRFYINNYDIIVVEGLQIQNMVKNRRLAQKILDALWGKFLQILAFKAERAGKVVVKQRGHPLKAHPLIEIFEIFGWESSPNRHNAAVTLTRIGMVEVQGF